MLCWVFCCFTSLKNSFSIYIKIINAFCVDYGAEVYRVYKITAKLIPQRHVPEAIA